VWRRGATRDVVEGCPRVSPPRCRYRPSLAEVSRVEERRGLTHRGGHLSRISLRPTFFPVWSSARCRSAPAADACTPAHLDTAQRWPSYTARQSRGVATETTST
jgi:hypothetical protein